MVLGLVLIAFGILYLLKPTVFRRGIWLRTSVAIRLMSEENYIKYMRVLGVVFIVAGVAFIVRS
jgi:hypothetical protein